MTVFHLTTNEGTCYVRCTRQTIYAAMHAYIARKRALGLSLSAITYTFAPITILTTPP